MSPVKISCPVLLDWLGAEFAELFCLGKKCHHKRTYLRNVFVNSSNETSKITAIYCLTTWAFDAKGKIMLNSDPWKANHVARKNLSDDGQDWQLALPSEDNPRDVKRKITNMAIKLL